MRIEAEIDAEPTRQAARLQDELKTMKEGEMAQMVFNAHGRTIGYFVLRKVELSQEKLEETTEAEPAAEFVRIPYCPVFKTRTQVSDIMEVSSQ